MHGTIQPKHSHARRGNSDTTHKTTPSRVPHAARISEFVLQMIVVSPSFRSEGCLREGSPRHATSGRASSGTLPLRPPHLHGTQSREVLYLPTFTSPPVDCYIDWLDAFKTSPCSFFCGGVVTAVVIAAEVYLMGRCGGEVLASSLVKGV
jgi:hypothetical protein